MLAFSLCVCVRVWLHKPVCMCVYLMEFYFCEIPFQLCSKTHLYLPVELLASQSTQGIADLKDSLLGF